MSADRIIDDMHERAYDEVGEIADEWPDVTKEARAELDALIRAWAEKYAPTPFWTSDGDPERIDPSEDNEP